MEAELAKEGVSLSAPCCPYTLPLYVACQRQHIHLIKLFLAKKADVNSVRTSDFDTTLHVAASEGSMTIVEMLLAAGANTKLRRRSGQTVIPLSRLLHGTPFQSALTATMCLNVTGPL